MASGSIGNKKTTTTSSVGVTGKITDESGVTGYLKVPATRGYTGLETDTTTVTVDNTNRTIAADVKDGVFDDLQEKILDVKLPTSTTKIIPSNLYDKLTSQTVNKLVYNGKTYILSSDVNGELVYTSTDSDSVSSLIIDKLTREFTETTKVIKEGSVVSVSDIGTSTDEVYYITIDDVEYKLAGGGTGDVTKAYVDTQDTATLTSAKWYTDVEAAKKQDKLTAGTNIEITDDNKINCTAEGKTYTEGTGIDISTTNEISADNDVVAFQDDIKYTNTAGCTVTVGGITKGTSFDNKSVVSILEDMLYPYVAFTFSNISTTDGSGTFEYGTTKSITKVKPAFTKGSKNITSVLIGTTSGGSDLYSGTSATSGTDITLTNSTSWDGKSTKTIYCTLSDGTTTTTKSASFSFNYYVYYAITDGTDAPVSWTKASSAGKDGEITVSYNAGQYLWLAYEKNTSVSAIQSYNPLSKDWSNIGVGTVKSSSTMVMTLVSGATFDYYTYRSGSGMAAQGTNVRFRLN